MDSPQQTAHAAGKAASASVARMQAKAAQLAEELRLAQAQSSSPLSNVATGTLERTHTACPEAYTEAGSPKPSVTALSAPSVFRRLSAASAAATKPAAQSTADPTYQAVALQCQKLEAEVQLWKTKHAEAIKEIDRHQDSYMRREEQLKAQLAAVTQPQDATAGPASSSADSGSADAAPRSSSGAAYESESGGSGGSTAAHKNRGQKQQTLQDMQQQVLEGLDELLQRQRLQMRTEESQQLRQFRGRLVEIEAQLAAYRQAAAASQDDWMGKTVALREELGVTQDIASKLDAMYKLAEQEAAHLRVQFKAQEDDRQLLIRQILGLKRENAKLKQEQAALQDELDQIMALALEAEAEPLTNHVGSPWPAADQRHGRQAGPSNSSSLAAAIAEVVERRGSAGGTSSRPQSASVGSRPQTASQQSRLQQQQHQARPRSAAPNGQQQQQHSHSMRLSGHTAAGAVGNVPNDPAAVEARMIRYSHVIQKLQKLLEVERRQLRQVRNSYNAELSKRTELQTLLLNSIELAKQQQRDAETANQQSQLPQQQGLESQPRSAARAAGSVSRPASAALGIRQLAYHSRPDSPAAGGRRPGLNAAAGAFESQQLDQAAWENLLADLLAQRQVLELLFKQAFPDFVAEADELFTGSRESHGEHLQQPQQQPEELAKQLASRRQQHRQLTLDQTELQQPEPWLRQQQEATLGLTERPDSASSDSPVI